MAFGHKPTYALTGLVLLPALLFPSSAKASDGDIDTVLLILFLLVLLYPLPAIVGFALGDLDLNGVVNAADWTLQRDGFGANLGSLTPVQALTHGDLNGDLQSNEYDFAIFKAVYEERNGAGSFAAMLQVPEPTAAMLGLLAFGLVARIRNGSRRRGA